MMIYLFFPNVSDTKKMEKKMWMVKNNSKAILRIDVYAITLRNHQIYFHSFIISPSSYLYARPEEKKPDAFNSYSIPVFNHDECNRKNFLHKKQTPFKEWKELKIHLLQIRKSTKEHIYPSQTTTNEKHKCFNRILHAK